WSAASAVMHPEVTDAPVLPPNVPELTTSEQLPLGSLAQPKSPGPSPAGAKGQPPPPPAARLSTWSKDDDGTAGGGGAYTVPVLVAWAHSQAEIVNEITFAAVGPPHCAWEQASTVVPV